MLNLLLLLILRTKFAPELLGHLLRGQLLLLLLHLLKAHIIWCKAIVCNCLRLLKRLPIRCGKALLWIIR